MLFPILLFPAVFEAQNGNYYPYKQPIETPKTTIFGRVFYEDTGKPVRRGVISLLKIPAPREDDLKTYENLDEVYNSKTATNESGEFKMEDISPGEYYAYLDVAGVLNPNIYNDFYRDGLKVSTAKLDAVFQKIVVAEGVKEMPVLIRVKRGGAIGGRILYADGEPAINVKVEILRKGDVFENQNRTPSRSQGATDDRGVYRFPGLPPGEYTVRIIEPANTTQIGSNTYESSKLHTYYGDTPKAKEAKTIELALGEEKSEINITIPDRKTYRISGIVIGKSNKNILPNSRLRFIVKGDESVLSYQLVSDYSSFTSDEKGRWTAIDLPAGTYIVTVSPPYDYLMDEEPKQGKNEPRFAETKKEIVIEDKDLENVIFELPIAAVISGTVVFEDKREIKDLYVFIYDEEKEISSSTTFNESRYEENKKTPQTRWNFALSDVAEGNYFVNVSSFGAQGDFYVKSIKSGSTDLESAPLQLKEGEEIKNIQIVLATDMGTLKGKVETNNREDIKGWRAVIVSVDKPNARNLMWGADVNAEGEFQLKAAPGDYYLVLQPKSVLKENSKLSDEEWLQKFIKDAEKVKIKANETQTVTIKR